MRDFSLSREYRKVFQEELCDSQGRKWAIDPDFHTVLRCLRVLADPDANDSDKLYLLMRWFFLGAFVQEGVSMFTAFVCGGKEADEDGDPPLMDFEQDADALYSSFMAAYHIDLTTEKMHWRKFQALLDGLGEGTPIRTRMSVRDMDISKLKGKDRARAEKAKRAVALETRISKAEKELQEKIADALSRGEDPAELLKKWSESDD